MSQYSTIALPGREQNQAWRRNQNTVRYRFGSGLGPVSNTVLIAVMLCVLGLLYLTQITKTSTYWYQLNDLEKKKEQLVGDKRDLEVEAARLQALERTRQSDVAKAMTTPAATDYVKTN